MTEARGHCLSHFLALHLALKEIRTVRAHIRPVNILGQFFRQFILTLEHGVLFPFGEDGSSFVEADSACVVGNGRKWNDSDA